VPYRAGINAALWVEKNSTGAAEPLGQCGAGGLVQDSAVEQGVKPADAASTRDGQQGTANARAL
tara:strand:+ start:2349 stop:2540 length:192 start_codon:yes stop_codon:yes gene_type:complete